MDDEPKRPRLGGRKSKWLLRIMREFDPDQARQLTEALETLGGTGDWGPLVQISDAVLALVGGRRFEGESGSIQP